jgi:hypothetical protein
VPYWQCPSQEKQRDEVDWVQQPMMASVPSPGKDANLNFRGSGDHR